MKKDRTCALYHRVSRRDQNPRNARVELKRHAKRMGYRVAMLEEETASSIGERPALERVMVAARAGRVDCVIVWKLDRFGRSMIDILTRIRELEAMGVRFCASSQGIDVGPQSGAVGRYTLNSLAAAAELERELIVERTYLGLDAARRRGVKLGRPLVRIDLTVVARMRDAGKSWDDIADALGVGRQTVRRAVRRDLAADIVSNNSAVNEILDRSKTVVENGGANPAISGSVGRPLKNGRI